MARTVSFYTLGCKLNFSETATLARQFTDQGYEARSFHQPADVYLINTCSVTENADRKCRKVVKQALKQNPQAYIIIVGCYAQLKPQEIAQIPGVDAVLGAAEKFRLFEHVQQFTKQPKQAPAAVYRSPIADVHDFVPSWSSEERTRAFLKIQDGCDYKCAFCTIPLARGKSRSATLPSILQQAHLLAQDDIQEIVISGINLGDYGHGVPHTLLEVFQALDSEPGLPGRLRISSIEPNLLTNELIDFVAQSTRFVPHFHIPLQSGSDHVLALMRRRYRSDLYRERIARIKAAMPDAGIGCDVITGHPGEGETEFLETYTFLNELDVSYLHVFPYSERANTHALTLASSVPQAERLQRADRLRTLSLKKRRHHYLQHLGEWRPVLFEEKADKDGYMLGFTDNYIRVRTAYDPLLVNEVHNVRLARLNADGLVDIELPDEVLKHSA